MTGRVVTKLNWPKRELGTFEFQLQRCIGKSAISREKLRALQAHAREYPAATLKEFQKAPGPNGSEKTIWKTLRKNRWCFKKVVTCCGVDKL